VRRVREARYDRAPELSLAQPFQFRGGSYELDDSRYGVEVHFGFHHLSLGSVSVDETLYSSQSDWPVATKSLSRLLSFKVPLSWLDGAPALCSDGALAPCSASDDGALAPCFSDA